MNLKSIIQQSINNIRNRNVSTEKYRNFKIEFNNYNEILRKSERNDFPALNWDERYPQLNDKISTTPFDAHYIYHPAWAARIVAEVHPTKHIDIASYLPFCTILSAFVPVEFYDYRPAELTLKGLTNGQADLTKLPFEDNSIESLSCMHTVEHIGLGRYGDPIDPNGDLKAISELIRVLAKEGNLLFVVPVGKSLIKFNAHRIYSYDQIADYFSPLKIKEFSMVDDNRQFIENADPAYANQQNYGCGCWWFAKSSI